MIVPRRGWRFLLRPGWLAAAAMVLAVAAVCVALGLWQLRRLDDRLDRNDQLEGRRSAPVTTVEDLAAGAVDEVRYRRAAASGEYVAGDEVLLLSQSYRGSSGHHVLTPLVLDGGGAVLVDRGWVPLDVTGPPVAGAEPPPGRVTVTGYVESSRPGRIRPGVLAEVERVDLDVLEERLGRDLLPFYLRLESQQPAQQGYPLPASPPDLSPGPHLSYAIQWFLFAGVAVAGFMVLAVRRHLGRDLRAPRFRSEDDPATPDR